MERYINLAVGLALILLFGMGLGAAGGLDDSGAGPDGLVMGDSNAPGSYAVSFALELRDWPNTGGGVPSDIGGRFLRVAATVNDGVEFKLFTYDWQCGEPVDSVIPDVPNPDPCLPETICALGKGNKETCVQGLVIDSSNVPHVQAVALSTLVPLIIEDFDLPDTSFELVKLKGYVQSTAPLADVDGVLSAYAMGDAALAEN